MEISHQFRSLCVRSESILERYIAHIASTQQQQIEGIEINTTEIQIQDDSMHDDSQDQYIKDENQEYIKEETIEMVTENDCDTCDNVHLIKTTDTMNTTETQTIYIKDEDCVQNGTIQHSTIIKEITTAQILEKPPDFSSSTATVIKHEIITEAGK